MKLRPLADRVIVKRVENETKTASGIVIPDSAAEKPDQGEVLAVGPARRTTRANSLPCPSRWVTACCSANTVARPSKVDGDELLVMKEDDLFAVVEK